MNQPIDRDGNEIKSGDIVELDGNTQTKSKIIVTTTELIDGLVHIKEIFPGALVIHGYVHPNRLRVKVPEDPKEFLDNGPV